MNTLQKTYQIRIKTLQTPALALSLNAMFMSARASRVLF